MTFIDWFAGVGGFRRGMELAGHTCVGFCEFDKYAVMSYTSMHLITSDQRDQLATLPLKERQKEILKEEYKNGEWFAHDVRTVDSRRIPCSDCWCFGFPCQDISIAGELQGFNGARSSLFFRVMELLGEVGDSQRPNTLLIENVKNLLSVNGGWDFSRLLVELDKHGYDAEWQVLNSKDFGVPQNRERVFIVGHSRTASRCQVFPISGLDRPNLLQVDQFGYMPSSTRWNPQRYRCYDPKDSIAPTLDSMEGGGREPHVGLFAETMPCVINADTRHQWERVYDTEGISAALQERDCKDPQRIAIPVEQMNKSPDHFQDEIFWSEGVGGALTARDWRDTRKVAVKVKEANSQGYDIATEGDAINFLYPNSPTRRGRVGHGVAQTLEAACTQGTVATVWNEKHQCEVAIRKLTPRECFRLQGWTDDYFERAEFVNSDSQLYKQAGNGVTVTVIQAIGEALNGKP